MNCDQCQPLLNDAVLGELPSEQQAAIDAPVSQCNDCQKAYNHSQAAFSLLAETVQPVAPPEGMRTRLMASLPKKQSSSAPLESPPPTIAFGMSEALDQPQEVASQKTEGATWSRGMLWAATLVGVAVGGIVTSTLMERSAENRVDQAALDKRQQAAEELASVMQSAQRLAGTGGLRSAAFESPQRPGLAAMLTWDVPSRKLHFHAVGLPKPPQGQEYQLWLIAAEDQWTFAGTLQESSGSHALLAPVPEALFAEDSGPVSAALTLSDGSGEGHGQEIARTQFTTK
ncbi:MAG: anti-sigma factor [Lacipirellulaceae bacterium]